MIDLKAETIRVVSHNCYEKYVPESQTFFHRVRLADTLKIFEPAQSGRRNVLFRHL